MKAPSTKAPLLLCGLGNPDPIFSTTRHNVGQRMLDLYAEAYRFPKFSYRRDLRGSLSQRDDVWLYQSGMFVNRCGPSIVLALRYFQEAFPDGKFCLIHDDMERKCGNVIMTPHGRGRGHNGIRSVCSSLGTDQFHRVSVGIGRPRVKIPKVVSGHVLGPFTPVETQTLEKDSFPGLIKLIDAFRAGDDSSSMTLRIDRQTGQLVEKDIALDMGVVEVDGDEIK